MSRLKTIATMSDSKAAFSITRIEAADKETALLFLRQNYYKYAPLNKCLGNADCPELEEWCVKLLAGECASFKACTHDGTIIGVFLNANISSTDKFCPNLDDCSTPNFRVEMEFLAHIDQQYNLWQEYPQHAHGLEAGVLSVHPAYRGQGVAKALTERTVSYARETGFPIILCHCSSAVSAKVCAIAGFKEVYRLAYEDYVVEGVRPLRPEEPHREFAVFVYELNTN